MTVEKPCEGVALATLIDDLDVRSGRGLRDRVAELVRYEPTCLVLNLSRIGFCDSTGLSGLIGIWHTAVRRFGRYCRRTDPSAAHAQPHRRGRTLSRASDSRRRGARRAGSAVLTETTPYGWDARNNAHLRQAPAGERPHR
ncbi:STAS domain-containing protein [Streptomyces sp. NRRL B-24085]|uniref:STAS domain-containing protein n=1 Tax=Streptomyces sp. NRRL B-24085 TaxID=1709476 RepID=UPI00358EACE3